MMKTKYSRSSQGFTLVELMVAIFVGLIVSGLAVAALGSTNSATLRILSKSEAQLNTRESISTIFADLADADSLEVCRVATTKKAQDDIRSSVQDHDMGRPGQFGSHTFTIDQCKETALTGYVVGLAFPNKLCYFVTEKSTDGKSNFEKSPLVTCIARGGDGGLNIYSESEDPEALPLGGNDGPLGFSLGECFNFTPGGNAKEVYLYTCNAPTGSGNALDWPVGGYSPDDNSIRLVANLQAQRPKADDVPTSNLFDYVLSDVTTCPEEDEAAMGAVMSVGSPSGVAGVGYVKIGETGYVDIGTDVQYECLLAEIIGININMSTDYNTYSKSSGEVNPTAQYVFNQSIVLRKSKTSLGENFNG